MPITDALGTSHLCPTPHEQLPKSNAITAPPCTPAERAIIKSYGGWTNFMLSFGLKPYNDDDLEEAKTILAAFASDDTN